MVLEAGEEAIGSWPNYYDSLTLFSPARYSELPGRRFGGDPERYPTRDEVAEYLRAYAGDLDAEIRTGQRVEHVERVNEASFRVRTEAGLELRAKRLIAATGGFGTPSPTAARPRRLHRRRPARRRIPRATSLSPRNVSS